MTSSFVRIPYNCTTCIWKRTKGCIIEHTVRTSGAIRLQFSVYEVNNTQRIIDNIKSKIETKYSKLFGGADSVIIFEAPNAKVQKYGNAIHRDVDIVYL